MITFAHFLNKNSKLVSMKLIKQLFPIFIVLALWSSCTTDDTPIPGVTSPSSSISSNAETITPGDSVTVTLTANDGDSPLNTLTIQKDGASIATTSVLVNGSQPASATILLFGADKSSFSYDITIIPTLMDGESATYTFIVAAENGDNTVESIFIDAVAPNVPPTLVQNVPGDWIGVAPGELLTDGITATQNGGLLSTFAAYENGILMEANRLSFGTTLFTENPRNLTTGEQDGFAVDLVVAAHQEGDMRTYMYVLTDVDGLTDTMRYNVTVDAGTPVDSVKVNLTLSNAGGPTNRGGVNLITGAQTGSNNAGAHLKDQGINTSLPAATNWIQKIAAGQATETLKQVTTVTNYDDIATKEEIQDLFDNGSTTVTETSKIVGNELLVLKTKSGAYVIVRVDEVVVKTTDNTDYYTLSAKF